MNLQCYMLGNLSKIQCDFLLGHSRRLFFLCGRYCYVNQAKVFVNVNLKFCVTLTIDDCVFIIKPF